MGVEQILKQLITVEQVAGNDPEKLAELEQIYEAGVRTLGTSKPFLRQRNQFRIRHIRDMRILRPRMLFEGRTFSGLNFQSLPALRSADTVILSYEDNQRPVTDGDILRINPLHFGMQHLVQALPDGFLPDFYFNYQVCTSRYFLSGWENAPFPTVGGLCHMFMSRSCTEIARMFDFVLPLSARFSDLLKTTISPEKIIDIPFGLNWGHFNNMISPGADEARDIDVLLSFPESPDNGLYGNIRARAHRLFHEAEDRLGQRWNFFYPGNVDKDEYIALLQRSRIVLNAVGIHGPYNYRTSEAIAAGALLMQLEPDFVTGPQHMEHYLKPDAEYVPYNADNFLTKLEALLSDEPRRAEIARNGMQRMNADYSYDALYARLFQELAPRLKGGWRERRISPERAVLSRIGHQMQLLCVDRMTDRGRINISGSDLNKILLGRIGDPYALLLAMYARLSPDLRQQITEKMLTGEASDSTDPKVRLRFYDVMLQNIKQPSPVDLYNYILLCAAEGRADTHKTQAALNTLNRPGRTLSEAEMLRVHTLPELPGLSDRDLRRDRIRIYNLPALLSGDPAVLQKSATDYMRRNLYLVMKMTDPAAADAWQAKADALLAAYPMENPRMSAPPREEQLSGAAE